MNKQLPFLHSLLILVLVIFLVSACQQQLAGTIVWIDVPVNNLTLPDPQALTIEGHASSPSGVSRVEIFVNEALLAEVYDLPREGTLSSFQAGWTPTASGEYVIRVVAYGVDGSASAPDSALVRIGGGTATPEMTATVTATPVITLTPTISLVPEPEVLFWADPQTITAGSCTDLHWEVTNALTVVFGGVEKPLTGSDSACICETQNYPLTVTRMDGTQKIVYVQVTVTGTCTVSDTTAPDAPTLAVPSNGLSLGCRSSQSLAWLPVTDPSGIAEYQVEVQRSTDNATWGAAPGSPITGLGDKTTVITTECGWYYRFRVRAIDGAGNVGAWSGWSYFSITLI